MRILLANDGIAYLMDNLPEIPALITMPMTKALRHLMIIMPSRDRLLMIEAILTATNVTLLEGTQTNFGQRNDRSTTIEAMRLADTLMV